MADKTVYVDGTTSTGHYASLAAAIAGELTANPNLTAGGMNGVLHIEISMSAQDTAQASFSGFTTDATHYIHVYTTAAQRAGRTWNTGRYRLECSGLNGGNVIEVATGSFVNLDGLQIASTSPAGSSNGIRHLGGGTISNCLVRGPGGSSYAFTGIQLSENYTRYVFNCIIYNVGSNSSSNALYHADGTVSVYSCVGIIPNSSSPYNLRNASGTMTAKNCYFAGCPGYDYNGTIGKTNCASSDTTAGTSNGCLSNVAYDTDTFVNVTSGSEDFGLAADGLSPLQGAGTDTSSESAPLNFTTDIEGDTRDATWDIGADSPTSGSGQGARSTVFFVMNW